jgi:peptidoglycan/xylan/chitin deacetylase (PgdA/CDA1 family)
MRAWMRQEYIFISACLALLGLTSIARADSCPDHPDALGTSRIITLDTSKGFEVGEKFGRGLPLAKKEVVLTFDDGPLLPYSERVRQTLKEECVRATFFLVGRNATTYPEFVRKLAADGHTIATHTWSHDMHMPEKPLAEGLSQINRGIAAVNVALKDSPDQPIAAPFFRFPGLNSDNELRQSLKNRGIGVFDIDIEGGDWIKNATPENVLDRAMSQLHKRGRGIILLHDIQPRTAAILPSFLKRLKEEGYKVVHVMPMHKRPSEDMMIASAGLRQNNTDSPPSSTSEKTILASDAPITEQDLVVRPVNEAALALRRKHVVARADAERSSQTASAQDEPRWAIEKIYPNRGRPYEPVALRVNPSSSYYEAQPQPRRSYYAEARSPSRPPPSKYLLNSLFDGLRGAN